MLEVLRHQDLEGVLATVVRYYSGIQLRAGGWVRACPDAIAQASKEKAKVPIVKRRLLRCSVPYALEGLLRREIDGTGGVLSYVQHNQQFEFSFFIAELEFKVLVARLNEAGQGKLSCLDTKT